MYICILIHSKIYSIKLNIKRCIRKRHLNIILKFIKVKTKVKFQKLFEVWNIYKSNFKFSLKNQMVILRYWWRLCPWKSSIHCIMPWIFKFKCLSRNFDIYTFTAKQEIVLRLRFLSKRVELMLSFHHNFWIDFIYLFLDGGKWRERGKETSMRERNTDWLLLVWGLTGDQSCNPGTCPVLEWNWQPFTLWDDTQSTEPHQSGIFSL